jgi:hypothetical protein
METLRHFKGTFILLGFMMISSPFIIGGIREDLAEHLMQKLPINKFMLIRALMLSGMMFVMMGLVL